MPLRLPNSYVLALALGFAATGSSTPLYADDDVSAKIALPHSPWLALRFEQDGDYVPLYNVETLRSEITLQRKPFTIVLPTRSEDDTYRISVWKDETIFTEAKPRQRADRSRATGVPPFFSGGTAMAETAAMSGSLIMQKMAHHYLNGLRLGPDPDRQIMHVGAVTLIDEDRTRTTRLMRDVRDPIYMVAWYDDNGDETMSHGEYEFLLLRFR